MKPSTGAYGGKPIRMGSATRRVYKPGSYDGDHMKRSPSGGRTYGDRATCVFEVVPVIVSLIITIYFNFFLGRS
ncbi:uncharacterized protein MELLADRAFT_54119 [Melampsora larici-populina 98AG31]|uniref:Uncharacterized protein n=1 Tax=Melampsora larici-populina (strain 98AG31 / pathotype 3-4-7) TaxID=747676 RepID=F4S936_MELLP|nr:uncharacterized protein MELLADRAFT_54119 [Melampsora larici-populina 98AG31]EGF98854.1 hypothetical protein MELLADRAFT_54119 [Melampsora larici-populina 98AG31]